MVSDLTKMIDQVSREKAVERDILIRALEEAVRAAARKKHGPDYDLEVTYNEELGEIEVFEFKEVVEDVTNEHVQITLEDAHKMDPESEYGDSLGIKMDMDVPIHLLREQQQGKKKQNQSEKLSHCFFSFYTKITTKLTEPIKPLSFIKIAIIMPIYPRWMTRNLIFSVIFSLPWTHIPDTADLLP